MNMELLNALVQEDMGEIAGLMIRPSRDFTGGSFPYEVDINKDAVYYNGYNHLIRTDVWMNNILEIDEFSMWVNRILYILDVEADNDIWDYDVCEYLESLGVDVEHDGSDYTYNFPDHCYLDRDIHYTKFSHDGDYYVVFSVHYGADARGGFGDVACFKISDVDYFHDSMIITLDEYVEEKNEYINHEFSDLEEIGEYNKEKDAWFHKETGNELYLSSSANGF